LAGGPARPSLSEPTISWLLALALSVHALSVLSSPAHAASPLLPAADVADIDLRAWWRQGELVVGLPEAPGRPGLRPLESLAPVMLPADLDAWAALGDSCVTRPESRLKVGERKLTARVTASAEGPVVQLLDGKQVVAVNALGRPALVCEVLLADADALPGPEILVAWRLEVGDEAGGELRGFTVWRVPESLL